MAEVTEFRPSTTENEAVPEPFETPLTESEQTKKRKPGPGRPRKDTPRSTQTREPQFFERVASIPKEDWGTRAFIYVYMDEPVVQKKTFGATRYLTKSSKPILDLEELKQEYGSFRGWMSLNLRKTGKDLTGEADRLDFEIYDPKYPPKIPKAAWSNDERNVRWLALLPPEPQPSPAATSTSSLIEGARFYKEIRDEVKDEMEPPVAEEPRTRTNEVLETMRAAKELFAPVVVAPPQNEEKPVAVDPWAAAEKILNMRAENPMMAILQEQMKASAAATEAERERAFKAAEAAREREFKLQQQLLESKTNTAAPRSLIDQVTEIAGALDKLGPLRALFGGGTAAETTVRAVRSTTLDVVRDVFKDFLGSPLATGVGQWLGSVAQRNVGPPPAMNPGTPQQQVAQRPADDIGSFLNNVLNPALLRHYLQGFSGGEFAGWLFDAFPERLKELQQFTHPRLPGMMGATAIITAYKHTDNMWPTLSTARPGGEADFTEFVNEFCAWKPEDETMDAETVPTDEPETDEQPERIQ